MKIADWIEVSANEPLYILLREHTDNDIVAGRAFESVCDALSSEKAAPMGVADISYFKTLSRNRLLKLAHGRKKVKRCLMNTRKDLMEENS